MARVEAGTLLSGKYRLERPIGQGGMGWVWKAQHVQWDAPVAIKLIDVRQLASRADAPAPTADSPLLQRFFGEARAAAAIRSPHVVQILDDGVDPALQLPFIVMELLEGETLEQRLSRERRLPPDVTANILTQVARALTRVHEANMVHRDLKPSNVFLVPNEDEVLAKVLDFGIAKGGTGMGTGTPITATGEQMGTPFYMCPEQIRGQRHIDYKADIWAFGVIAYECLTGVRPFGGETLGALSLSICVEPLPIPSRAASVPAGFDAWFLRSVSRDRTLTFRSAKEASDGLRSALTGPLTRAVGQVREHRRGAENPTPHQPAPALDTTAAAITPARPMPGALRRRSTALAAATVVVAVGGGWYLLGRASNGEGDATADVPRTAVTSTLTLPDPPQTVVTPIGQAIPTEAVNPSPEPDSVSEESSAVGAHSGANTSHVSAPARVQTPRPRRPSTAPLSTPAMPPPPTAEVPAPKTPLDLIEERL
jgi:eukaryotic-like serine/threonine-protein kinase